MTGTPRSAQAFAYLRATSVAPGFSSPIELRIPEGVSAMRYWGFPGRAAGVVPLFTIAPSLDTSMSSAYSTPWPKVPDAVSTGFFRRRPRAASTSRSTPPQEAPQRGRFPKERPPSLSLSRAPKRPTEEGARDAALRTQARGAAARDAARRERSAA